MRIERVRASWKDVEKVWKPWRCARRLWRRGRNFAWSIWSSDDASLRMRERPRVLVRVRAAGVNPVDTKWLYGDKVCAWMTGLVRSAVEGAGVGFDFSGVVERADEGSGFEIGDEVFGLAPPMVGSIGEFVKVPSDMIALKSNKMTFRQAASIGLCGVSVTQALDQFKSKFAPSPALVIGASGGLGHMACQICAAEGARVVGVCSRANLEYVRSLGVEAAFPYDDEAETLERHLERAGYAGTFRIIIDTVTSNAKEDARFDYESRLRPFATKDASYVKFGGTPGRWAMAHIIRLGIPLRGVGAPFWIYFYQCDRQLRYLADAFDRGDFVPTVADSFPFTDVGVRDAFALVRSRHAVGKVVIDVDVDHTDTRTAA